MQNKAIEEDSSIPVLLIAKNNSARPSWTKTTSPFKEDKDIILRIGYDKVSPHTIDIVRDSIKQDLRNLLVGDVETRVERTIVDSISSHIVGIGKEKEIVRDHILTIVSRHYSPPLVFNGNYDTNEYWTDEQQDTLWYKITFNKKRYIIDQNVKIITALEKAKIEAYKYLKKAFASLSYSNNVEASLSNLGVASYYISKGGGEAELSDIFNPGTKSRISFQRKELIKEIDKAIQLQFINVKNRVTISRDDVTKIRIKCRNPKNYDLSRVKIRISSKGSIIEHPSTIKLDDKGMAEFNIAINPQTFDTYDRDIHMEISFDIFSESLLPDEDWKTWVDTEDYSELLEELPTISLPIHTIEFQPRSTWAILSERNLYSSEINHDELQSELERSISRHPDLFLLVEKEKWQIDYKEYQQYKSGLKRFDEFGNDRYDLEKHDIDVLLSIDKKQNNKYDMHIEIGSAKRSEGGIIASSILGISSKALESSIEILVENLVDEYFYRELMIVAPNNDKISTYINGVRINPDSNKNNRFVYKKLPRFLTQNITVKRTNFRPQLTRIVGESFTTNITPPAQEIINLDVFTPLMGTLTINVKDAVTRKVISFGKKGQGKAPRITLRRRLLFLPSPIKYKFSDYTSVATFSIQSMGKYYISIKKDFYTVPFLPHIITHEVVDDFHPRSSELNNLVIYLKKSDPKYAKRMSIFLPGLGQYYLNKQGQALGFLAATALSSAISLHSYIQYSDEVAHYNDLKAEYFTSDEADWYVLESKLSSSKSRLNRLRPQFYSVLITGSIVWILNIITVTW